MLLAFYGGVRHLQIAVFENIIINSSYIVLYEQQYCTEQRKRLSPSPY